MSVSRPSCVSIRNEATLHVALSVGRSVGHQLVFRPTRSDGVAYMTLFFHLNASRHYMNTRNRLQHSLVLIYNLADGELWWPFSNARQTTESAREPAELGFREKIGKIELMSFG